MATVTSIERFVVVARQQGGERLSGFSDAVFAVIVTIMVLELKPPTAPTLAALLPLWPTLISYVVSFLFIAIIWINHHYLAQLLGVWTQGLIWTNFVHLFLISLLPFATAWIADTKLASVPVMMYAALFVCIDTVYNWFEIRVLQQARVSRRARTVARRRSVIVWLLFAFATAIASLQPWIAFGVICLALVLHLKPDVGARRSQARIPPRDETTRSAIPSDTRVDHR